MAVGKSINVSSFVRDLFDVGIYKRTQGRITRQATCLTLWVAFWIGAWRLHDMMVRVDFLWRITLPLLLVAVGMWASYRIVNYARFADFLISVEAEMNKVSWPSKMELIRSSMVVIFVIFSLALVLFGFDVLWKFLFRTVLGIIS